MPRKKVETVDETVTLAYALRELCEQKGLPKQVVIDAMSESLKKAYFKFSGDYPDTIIKVDIDLEQGKIKMSKIKNVVAEIEDDVFETDPDEAFDETGIHYNVGDVIETPIDINDFKRAAAMQAKTVFKQKLREAEKQVVVEQYSDKVGDILSGTVDAVESKHCIVRIGHTNAYLSKQSILPNETLKIGQQIMVYVEEVVKGASGTPIVVSRTNPRFVTRLMEQDIAEIYDGTVEIKGVSRMPGIRSKVSVYSKDPNIDPSGSCIGPRGMRIARVLSQIPNEKIDVVNYNENPLLYVADALKPAQVIGVQLLDEETKACRAIVQDDQYSLAIGKEAQNVNLAVRLTNWKIDIKSISEAEKAGYSYQTVEELKFMEQAKKQRNVVAKAMEEVPTVSEVIAPVEAEAPTVEKVEEVKEVKPTPVVEAKPVVEEKVEEVKPTKTKGKAVDFSQLEALINSKPTETAAPVKKKWVKKSDKAEEEELEDSITKTPISPANTLPIYTEEELAALEKEELEENDKYDDEVDYDEFEDYYEDN